MKRFMICFLREMTSSLHTMFIFALVARTQRSCLERKTVTTGPVDLLKTSFNFTKRMSYTHVSCKSKFLTAHLYCMEYRHFLSDT